MRKSLRYRLGNRVPRCFHYEKPAPPLACELLLLRLSRWLQFYTPDLLEELRQMLAKYTPRQISFSLQGAYLQMVGEGLLPGWPDHGEIDALLDLEFGLVELFGLSDELPHVAMAA